MLQVIGWCAVAANAVACWYMVSHKLFFGAILALMLVLLLTYVLTSDRA